VTPKTKPATSSPDGPDAIFTTLPTDGLAKFSRPGLANPGAATNPAYSDRAGSGPNHS
jgi:hypothetical protein